MFRWIVKLVDRFFAIAGGVLLAQFPQFFAQYINQLSGHLAELRYQVSLMQQAAALTNKNLIQWIDKFLQNSDPDVIKQGQLMQGMTERLESFIKAQDVLTHASLFTKPFLFVRYADSEIVRATFKEFHWGFTFTLETLAYALIGILLGLLVFQLLRSFFLFLGSRFPGRKKSAQLSNKP